MGCDSEQTLGAGTARYVDQQPSLIWASWRLAAETRKQAQWLAQCQHDQHVPSQALLGTQHSCLLTHSTAHAHQAAKHAISP